MIRMVARLVVLLAPFTLAAQDSSHPSTAAPHVHSLPGGIAIFHPETAGACPIAMHATQGMWDHTVRVRDGKREPEPPHIGQRIALALKDTHPSQIVSALVRVRGLNGKDRIMPTPAGTEQDWNAVTTLNVKFGSENDGSVSADLRVAGFTAVHSVELIRVTYADGSRWNRSGSQTCRVQPDPLMLVTER